MKASKIQIAAAAYRLDRPSQVELRVTYIREAAPNSFSKQEKEEFVNEVARQSHLRIHRNNNKPSTPYSFNKHKQLKKLMGIVSKDFASFWNFRTASMGNSWEATRAEAERPYIAVYTSKDWNGYSKKCSYPAISYHFKLRIPYGWHLLQIGDVMTAVKGSYNRNKVVEATWWKQSRGMEVMPIDGYIYKGYHIVAKDEQQAMKKVDKIRKQAACNLLKSRIMAKLQPNRIWVTLQDSLAAGNCEIGTKNFAERIGIDLTSIGAVRADYLIEQAERIGNMSYVQRAINVAKMKHVNF